MKKVLAILALVAFMGGIGAPAFAATSQETIAITLADKDPEKKESKDKKSKDCSTKAESKKAKEAKKKAPCEKTCGGGSE
jgi:prophage tail gpP-like protein